VVTSIILITFISSYFLLAGTKIYTLESENNDFSDVITWIDSKDQLLPVTRTEIRAKQSNIDLNEAKYFYSDRDKGFGTKRLSRSRQGTNLHIKWYDLEGKLSGQWHEPLLNDMPFPVVRIDHISGRLISVDYLNRVRVINSDGTISRQFQIVDSDKFHTENNTYIDLNNGLLHVGTTEIFPSINDRSKHKSTIYIFNLDGKVYQHFDLDEWRIRSLNGSQDGQIVAVSLFRMEKEGTSYQFRTVVLDIEGNVLLDHPVNCRKAVFNHNNSKIFLMDKNVGYLIDLQTQAQIAKTTVKDDGNIYLSAVFMPPSDLLAIQDGRAKQGQHEGRTSWIFSNIRIKSLNDLGQEISDLPIEDISVERPALWYDQETGRLVIGHRQGWKIFKVNF